MSTKCRRCRMPIPDGALKCPYCHEDPGTVSSLAVKAYKEYGFFGALMIFLVAIGLLVAIFYFFGEKILGPQYYELLDTIKQLF